MCGNAPLTLNATLMRWFPREKNEYFIPRQGCATFVREYNINLPPPTWGPSPQCATNAEEESFIDATFAMAKGGGAEIGPRVTSVRNWSL